MLCRCMSIGLYITRIQELITRFLPHLNTPGKNSASLNSSSPFVIRIPRTRLTRIPRPTIIASRHACVGRIALVSVTDSSTPL